MIINRGFIARCANLGFPFKYLLIFVNFNNQLNIIYKVSNFVCVVTNVYTKKMTFNAVNAVICFSEYRK